jgi:hypothetical protein
MDTKDDPLDYKTKLDHLEGYNTLLLDTIKTLKQEKMDELKKYETKISHLQGLMLENQKKSDLKIEALEKQLSLIMEEYDQLSKLNKIIDKNEEEIRLKDIKIEKLNNRVGELEKQEKIQENYSEILEDQEKKYKSLQKLYIDQLSLNHDLKTKISDLESLTKDPKAKLDLESPSKTVNSTQIYEKSNTKTQEPELYPQNEL